MGDNQDPVAARTSCDKCPLATLDSFRAFSSEELAFVKSFKTGELLAEKGSTVLLEGSHSAHLFTVLSGWGFRHKILEDGRRQILNYLLPGDLVGLQGTLLGEMQHSVEALTPMRLCVFERDRLDELYQGHASLAFDVTWISAQEERILDEHLLSVGRRNAFERAAYLIAFLGFRGRQTSMLTAKRKTIPLAQHHVADTLGLSLVHTNKTLRRLARAGLIRWLDRGCEIHDLDGLCAAAGWAPDLTRQRPYI